MLLGKTKNIAMLGIMAALSTVLAVLGTVISINTVFFTAVAAFFVGIAVVKYGSASGILFFFVCSMLDFFVNPFLRSMVPLFRGRKAREREL